MITSIDLSRIIFDNDVFSTSISKGEMIVFNRINENCRTKSGVLLLNMIAITFISNGKRTKISNVIGIKNGKFRIISSEKSIFGSHLTYDLLKMCYLEIDDGE